MIADWVQHRPDMAAFCTEPTITLGLAGRAARMGGAAVGGNRARARRARSRTALKKPVGRSVWRWLVP
jgi:hypothetical protein